MTPFYLLGMLAAGGLLLSLLYGLFKAEDL